MRTATPPRRAGLYLTAAVCGLAVLLAPVWSALIPSRTAADGVASPAGSDQVLPAQLAPVPQLALTKAPRVAFTLPTTPTPSATSAARRPPGPPRSLPSGLLLSQRGAPAGKRTVALTFDDGPDPTYTPQVLALLKRYHATATFCMIGENVQAHPELVQQVVKAGHRLCDHTVTHPLNVAGLPIATQRQEIIGGRADLAAVTSAPVRYFRAPGGNWSASMVTIATKQKMLSLDWTVDPRDWSLPGTAAIVDTV